MDKKTSSNRKRSNIISALKRKNLNLKKELQKHMDSEILTTEQESHLLNLEKDITRCANFSLYGQTPEGIKYFGSCFCGSKVCFVCNYARQKRIRRKYFKWFALNRELVQCSKNDKTKIVSETLFQEKFKLSGWNFVTRLHFDLMHLTLTVPHYLNGFRGEKYYFKTIADLFHNLRNENPDFGKYCYGGEYGIETTKTPANGLHIHIHALLFVRSTSQNRNHLHKIILQGWNKLTVNPDSPRRELNYETRQKIKASNKLINDSFIDSLNPQGTTLINLETIYSLQQGQKVRVKEYNSPEMMKAVLETIKYHFAPLAFDKGNQTFDIELMKELLPVIYRKQLYKKFGCIHGEKSLNIREDGTDILIEDFQDGINPETGEIISEIEYFICNPAIIYHNPQKDNEIILSHQAKRQRRKISAINTTEAINQMANIVKKSFHKN